MNTGNRVLWIAIGVVLTAAGVLGALASLNRLPFLRSDRVLLGTDAAGRWHSWDGWAVAATIAGGLLVAWLGFLLLRAQLRGRGGAPMPDLVLPAREPEVLTVGEHANTVELDAVDDGQSFVELVPGRTRVASRALHHALTRDLQSGGQVRRASVRLVGDRAQPEVLVRLAVSPEADAGRLRSHVDGALARFAVTSGSGRSCTTWS